MEHMSVNQLRQKFLDFFKQYDHEVVSSSSLIPQDDPTLLFTNAGMNQFKDVFLGLEKRNYVRATSAQKCVRAGGKHNDLDNVGYTARHHTFFEMLGNFSFGDYFKQDAIKYAWEFLTSKEWLAIPEDRLYVTVYKTDDEAFEIWHKEIGLDESRIIRIGDKPSGGSDNFWQMGDTGPCGPCTEIFYDHGADIPGGLPGTPDEDGDRFIEIWNCVFMQFNRDETGKLHPLPKPSVDTGMGLERISAVMQNVHSNYDIDLFKNIINEADKIVQANSRYKYLEFSGYDTKHSSLKVLADHIRSVSFLIADGALPSNEGRGYVLRRIIRRAIRHGYKLEFRVPFFHKLVKSLVQEMGAAYPELVLNQEKIESAIKMEEEQFFRTLDNGMVMLRKDICGIFRGFGSIKNCGIMYKIKEDDEDQDCLESLANFVNKEQQNLPNDIKVKFEEELENNQLSGTLAFKLHDTYGFPLDLTEDVCREVGITVDIDGFNKEMQNQKSMAKAAGKFKMDKTLEYSGCDTEFVGYTEQSTTAKITALYLDNRQVEELAKGQTGAIVLDNTVFYAVLI